MKLFRCNQDTNSKIYVMRERRVSWFGYCGDVGFPIVWYVLEAKRVERRWWGWEDMSGWFRAGPETYSPITD